jgi:nucleoid DNA-binding protein
MYEKSLHTFSLTTKERNYKMATKSDIIEKIAAKKGCTKVAAAADYEVIVAAIAESLHGGDAVALQGVGTLTIKTRKARSARNPRTGQTVQVGETRGVRFAVSPALKKSLNDKA